MPGSSSARSASSRTLIPGCAARNRGSRQISQRAANTGATDTVSTSSDFAARATAADTSPNPRTSCAVTSPPRAVGTIPDGRRSNSVSPSTFSARITCWLTAPAVTPISAAAAASEPSRATASTARKDCRGTRFNGFGI